MQSTFKVNNMNKHQEQIDSIREIRTLMERSTKFLSLSGLAGVFVGILAIIGVIIAYLLLDMDINQSSYYLLVSKNNGLLNGDVYSFILADFTLILLFALLIGIYFSKKKANKQNLAAWDSTAKRLLLNLAIPLITGGFFCLILLFHNNIGLVIPATLIFYGLALVNASKYTINDIRYLGLLEIGIGLFAAFFIDFGLLFWAFGFGVLHIVYGIAIYFKYEK